MKTEQMNKQELCANCGYSKETHKEFTEEHDFKHIYPRDVNGICSGCGLGSGRHKKKCPADIGRNPEGDKPCNKFKPKKEKRK